MFKKAQTLYLIDSTTCIDDEELATLSILEGSEVLKIVLEGRKQTVYTWVNEVWVEMPLTPEMIKELNQKIKNYI